MAGPRMSAQDAADKWAARVGQSGDYYRKGVQNTNKDWADASIAARERRNQGLIAAINNGTIDAGIQRAGTQKWRNNTLAVGVQNWTANTPRAKPAFLTGLQKSYGFMQAAANATQGMPRDTVQQRIAYAAAWQQAMHDQSQAAKASG